MGERACRYWQKAFLPSRFPPAQTACSDPACQRRRRNDYHRRKVAADPVYRLGCLESAQQWRAEPPDYWRQLLERNPARHARDFVPEKPRRSRGGGVQIPVHPHKGLSGAERAGRRKSVMRKAACQVPRNEKRLAARLQVGQTATVEGHTIKCPPASRILTKLWRGPPAWPPARNAGFPASVGPGRNVGVAGWKACTTALRPRTKSGR
jgi:hypothetical protein